MPVTARRAELAEVLLSGGFAAGSAAATVAFRWPRRDDMSLGDDAGTESRAAP